MVPVLLQPHRSGASVQRRYIEAGKFDFCIDGGERVTQLTSDPNGWPNIEAGQKIVMRVIFEQVVQSSCTYTCHLCGASNNLNIVSFGTSGWLTDGSIDWFVHGMHWWRCISHRKVMHAKEDFRSQSGNKAGPLKALSRTIGLTWKLGTAYAISVLCK
jgi:hypothetical protein